jgi:mono/diheme cytochrome c family protein
LSRRRIAPRRSPSFVLALALLAALALASAPALGAGALNTSTAPAGQGKDERPQDGDEEHAHVHAPVPPEYASLHVPAAAWSDGRLIARGREIYMSRCAVCHGDSGDGKGPAGIALPIRPPDLRDPKMTGEMAGNYWFWRVSEGGAVEPFKSMGSTMPAWKAELSVEDRWAVIAFQHTFSGHEGPHVVSEHPEMLRQGRDDRPRSDTRPASSHTH